MAASPNLGQDDNGTYIFSDNDTMIKIFLYLFVKIRECIYGQISTETMNVFLTALL